MEADRLIDQFKRAHDGDPWHGAPIMQILKGVTAEQAAMRPPNGAHSIWELVLHATGWRNEVVRRATGEPAQEPRRGTGRRSAIQRRSAGMRRLPHSTRHTPVWWKSCAA
jgi:hypothetical protein